MVSVLQPQRHPGHAVRCCQQQLAVPVLRLTPCRAAAPPHRSARQRYYATTAGVLLGLTILYAALFVASFAVVLAEDDCEWRWGD